MALPRNYRLRQRRFFEQLKARGKLLNGPYFAFLFLPQPKWPRARIGFIVSRKVSHRAVDRNYLRRRLANLSYRYRHQLPPLALLILAKKAALDASWEQLETHFQLLLKQLLALNVGSEGKKKFPGRPT